MIFKGLFYLMFCTIQSVYVYSDNSKGFGISNHIFRGTLSDANIETAANNGTRNKRHTQSEKSIIPSPLSPSPHPTVPSLSPSSYINKRDKNEEVEYNSRAASFYQGNGVLTYDALNYLTILPKQVRHLSRKLKKPLRDMNRDELLDVLAQVYALKKADAIDLARSLTELDIQQKIREATQNILKDEKGVTALENIEESDFDTSSRGVFVFTERSRTGTAAVVVLFNVLMRYLFGYDILERAAKEIQLERIRAQEAFRQGKPVSEIHPKLIEELISQAGVKTVPFSGIPIDPKRFDSFCDALDKLKKEPMPIEKPQKIFSF